MNYSRFYSTQKWVDNCYYRTSVNDSLKSELHETQQKQSFLSEEACPGKKEYLKYWVEANFVLTVTWLLTAEI